jgi:DNA-directed RNA polymerase specialized sigma24 family protein
MSETKQRGSKIQQFRQYLTEGKSPEEAGRLSGVSKGTLRVQMYKIKREMAGQEAETTTEPITE